MRCHICDRVLNEGEISYNNDHQEFDPCPACLVAISEVFGDEDEDKIVEEDGDELLVKEVFYGDT